MSGHQDRSARCFVYSAGFHTYNTVLHDIDDADAVFSAECIELFDDVGYFHFFAVDRLRNTCLKCHCHIFRLVRSFLRRYREYKKIVIVWLYRRIFQLKAFVADMPQVTVAAVAVFCIKRKIDAVCFAVLDLIFTGLHCPEICHTPRSDDLDVRSKSFDAKFETDLVVSFSCSAVADGNSAFLTCNLDQFLSDGRTCHGCSEQICVFIYSACFYARHDKIFGKFVNNIFNI